MELTQTVPQPKKEETPVKESLSVRQTDQEHELTASQEASAFVSASHEFAVKQYENATSLEDSTALAKAEQVAHSMGYSQSYDKNPFAPEQHKELARAFELGQRQQERILEETRIGKDDKEMDYDN